MLKIGIISNTPRVGKTTLALSLAHTYSRSQQAKVAIFSTGELSHVTEPLMETQEKDEAATAGVFKAMLETQTIRGEQLFSYAVRSGYDEVFIFDLFDRKDDKTLHLLRTNLLLISVMYYSIYLTRIVTLLTSCGSMLKHYRVRIKIKYFTYALNSIHG